MQESNQLLESRIINHRLNTVNPISESKINQNNIMGGVKKITKCFDSKKYPNLSKVSNGSIDTIFGLMMMWAGVTSEIFSLGLSTIASVAVGSAGVASSAVGLKKIFEANKDLLDDELESLYNCVFG
jgi:hypothetical protein